MIYAFTDFGHHDIYVGQLKAAIASHAPNATQIDLLHNAPSFDVLSSAHLLHALVRTLPTVDGDVFLAVVDPGVGGNRRPVVMRADGLWFVGPDNGLLSVAYQRASTCRLWEIVWRPERLSASFHGRDLFAPVAARIAEGTLGDEALKEIECLDVVFDPGELCRIVYIDHYGNAMTGVRQSSVSVHTRVQVKGYHLEHSMTFCEISEGEAFWYINSLGLLEIAVNGMSAADRFGLSVGEPVEIITL